MPDLENSFIDRTSMDVLCKPVDKCEPVNTLKVFREDPDEQGSKGKFHGRDICCLNIKSSNKKLSHDSKFFTNPLRLKHAKTSFRNDIRDNISCANNHDSAKNREIVQIWSAYTGKSGEKLRNFKLSSRLYLKHVSGSDATKVKHALQCVFSGFFLKKTSANNSHLSSEILSSMSKCVIPEHSLEFRSLIDSAVHDMDSRILYGTLIDIVDTQSSNL